MKKILILLFLLLLATKLIAQSNKIRTIINTNGDTLIEVPIVEAKIILTTILQKEISDSLISVYEKQDSIKNSAIFLLKNQIDIYKEKVSNLSYININTSKIISNKDEEILILNKAIKTQKREIFKQKVLKFVGFSTTIIAPILLYLILK